MITRFNPLLPGERRWISTLGTAPTAELEVILCLEKHPERGNEALANEIQIPTALFLCASAANSPRGREREFQKLGISETADSEIMNPTPDLCPALPSHLRLS